MNARYFKWETPFGTAYGKLPADYYGVNFIGITRTSVVSIPVDDPALVEITETEFSIWCEKIFSV